MLRVGKWKYCHYVGAPPQLFDLDADPEELTDIAGDPRFGATLAECERLLRAALDPEATDARAKRRQAELLALYGGREEGACARRPWVTPAPGTDAEINYTVSR
jgi:choline-sulfatase